MAEPAHRPAAEPDPGPDPDRAGAPGRVGISLGYAADRLEELPRALDAAAEAGAEVVELFLPAFGVVLGGRVDPAGLRALRAALADRPLAVTLHGPLSGDLGAEAGAALQLQVARACLAVADELGADALVQHATVATAGDAAAHAEAMAREAEALAALAPAARDAGCAIALETMWARPGERTATGSEIAATLCAIDDPWIGATLDFSHAWLNAVALGREPLAEIAALAPFARHLHVHDSFGRPAAFRPWTRGDALAFGFGDLHLPPGRGALPWDAFAGLGWRGAPVAMLELDRRWRGEWAEAARWTRRWVAGAARAASA